MTASSGFAGSVVTAMTSYALIAPSTLLFGAGLLCAVTAEILGRYLFFVSVVPQHQALPYVGLGSEAA